MKTKTRKSRSFAICACILLSIFVFVLNATPATAADKVKWNRIVGIIQPNGNVGEIVDGTPAAWTVTSGFAEIDLDTGKVKFKVKGLVIAGDPSFSNIGTTTVITKVKGTLICNETGGAEVVDTEAVTLSALGNATFNGSVELPQSCINEPEDIVFLIRIAEVVQGFEFLIDLWNAFGAVRARPAS